MTVERAGAVQWQITGNGNTILPPVLYGSVPASATQTQPPDGQAPLLAAGTTYVLTLEWRFGPIEGIAGRQDFTP